MRILGKTNIKVNEIGLGGIPIQHTSQEVVCEMIDKMIEKDMNFIDTARGYTISEELIGNAIYGKRHNFILATKSMSRTYEGMKKDIEISLSNLKTNYIDLYQLHNVQLKEDISGALRALNEAKEEGKVKHIGITTHSIEVLEREVNRNIFETVQFPYNIVEKQAEELFKKAKENNIGIIVMKPLAGGAINDSKLAIKYILNNENISVIIPGMDSITQIEENSSVKKGVYSQKEKDKINSLRKELDSNFCRRCGYCQPCPIGINIPLMFLCEGYYLRYNLKEWALSRYESMKTKPSECVKCGKCESKCPYNIKIRDRIDEIVRMMEENYE